MDIYNDLYEVHYMGKIDLIGIGECIVTMHHPLLDQISIDEHAPAHFHIAKEDNSFECAICIFDNKYYSHNGQYKDKLNKDQLVQLYNWINSDDDILNDVSNWSAFYGIWANYLDIDIDSNLHCPDYINTID